MRRPAFLIAALALAACSGPVTTGSGAFSGFGGFQQNQPPLPAGPAGQRDPRAEACRAEATRVVQYRDRGQLMRNDEIENRRDGNITVAPPSRAENDRLAQTFERDRIAAECYRAQQQQQPQRPAAAAGGAAPR
jgi:hypothetical protein